MCSDAVFYLAMACTKPDASVKIKHMQHTSQQRRATLKDRQLWRIVAAIGLRARRRFDLFVGGRVPA